MKIGILTYHRTNNYGAVLQAIATRMYLQNRGHEVKYIDYWPSYHAINYALFSWQRVFCSNLKASMSYLRKFICNYKYRRLRHLTFEKFFETQLYPYCVPVDTKLDMIIFGSDQIWRKQKTLKNYNPIYFGQGVMNAKKKCSYAASMGELPTSGSDDIILKQLLSNLDFISVREIDLQHYIQSLGFDNVYLSLDPTLMVNKELWDTLSPKINERPYKEKYVLYYDLLKDSFDYAEIKKYASNCGLSVKRLHKAAKGKHTDTEITTAGPIEFIQLIKHAECIFTSSFHGLVFSIIYGKEFYTSFSKNGLRAESILNLLNIKGRLLEPMKSIPTNITPIDYTRVYRDLDIAREKSKEYFDIILKD